MEGLYHASIARSVTCMGRFVSRLEAIPIYLFDLTATISSSRPKKRVALDGREHSGRLVGSRDLMLPITTIPRGARHQARASRRKLVFGRSVRIATMMQSCASAAKLRGGGPILRRGSKTKSQVGVLPVPRPGACSPPHRAVDPVAISKIRSDGIAFEAAALQNQIARRSDEMQFGCRERRGLPPILDDPLVLVRKLSWFISAC